MAKRSFQIPQNTAEAVRLFASYLAPYSFREGFDRRIGGCRFVTERFLANNAPLQNLNAIAHITEKVRFLFRALDVTASSPVRLRNYYLFTAWYEFRRSTTAEHLPDEGDYVQRATRPPRAPTGKPCVYADMQRYSDALFMGTV
jgi:hypothetical protein